MVNEPKDQQEPSMEEILSSIRRIIADEESEESDERSREPAEDQDQPAESDDEDVLELTEVVRESGDVVEFQADKPAAEAAGGPDDDMPEGEEVELTPDQREEPLPEEQPSRAADPAPAAEEGLMSAAAVGAAAGSFAKLNQTMRENPGEAGAGSGRSVEQFVADLLRPMLHAWLEENLPPIVERLVQEEIEKLAKRAELL